jgi:hypothetical protein
VLALAAGVLALVPAAIPSLSAALLSDTQTATSNTVGAGTCTSTAWADAVNATGTIASGNRDYWQRLDSTYDSKRKAYALPGDAWGSSSTAWTGSGIVHQADGALYCDADTAVTLNGSSDSVTSQSATQSTWGVSSSARTTVMLWVQTTSTTAGRILTMAEGTSGGSNADRVLYMDASGYLRFAGRSGSTSWSTTAGGAVINDGLWHLVAAQMNGRSTGGVTLYVDGTSVATVSGSSYPYRDFGSTNVTWTIGSQGAGNDPTAAPSGALLASVDELVIFDTDVLTSAEWTALYDAAGQ